MSTTTLTSWALLIWKALQNSGYDPRELFLDVGLNPKLLGDSNARYRAAKLDTLWQKSLQLTGDPCFGIEVGKLWSPTTFHALGFAWLASSSLADALRRFARYSRVIDDSLVTRLSKTGHYYELSLFSNDPGGIPHFAILDAAVVVAVKMCRMLCGPQFAPASVRLVCASTPTMLPLAAYTRCSVHYQSVNDGVDGSIFIEFDAAEAEAPLPTGNSALVDINETLALRYLNQMASGSTVDRVAGKLIELMPGGDVREQQVANALHISKRSLQRKLSSEGTTYNALLNHTRREMANNHLGNSHLSLSEIAYLLGFSEQSAFTRAFRRWHGVSPREYRKNLLRKSA